MDIAVIDPFSKKIWIPKSAVQDTQAKHRSGLPSLCRLYQLGTCRQGSHCRQVHASVEVVQRLRCEALRSVSCCAAHDSGRPAEFGTISADFVAIVAKKRVPRAHLSPTAGLRELVAASRSATRLVVPPQSVCRAHGSGTCCKFADDCKFVHICKTFLCADAADDGDDDSDVPACYSGDDAIVSGGPHVNGMSLTPVLPLPAVLASSVDTEVVSIRRHDPYAPVLTRSTALET